MKSPLFAFPWLFALLISILLPHSGLLASQDSDHTRSDPESKRPNILFIILDDLNVSVEGFGGHPQAYTPNMDLLAEQGVVFTNAATNAPICAPSRPSMLTGLYPHTTRYFGNPNESEGANGTYKYAWKHPVFEEAVTWMQHFRANGYEVVGAGKVDHNYAERWTDWEENGVRRYGPKPSWGPFPYKGSGRNPDSNTDMNFLLAARHPSQPEMGKLSFFVPLSEVPSTPPNPATGFEGYTGWFLYNQPYRYVSEDDRDPLPDELLASFVEDYLQQKADSGDDRPFFLNIGINRPHAPWVAPQKYFDLFPLEDIQLMPRKPNDLEDCAPFLHRNPATGKVSWTSGFGKYRKVADADLMREWTQAYLACVAYADDMIGRILRALEASPFADNTLVVITSDHGYHMGEKDFLFKNSVWEPSARIPLIIAGPGVARGASTDTPVSLVDLYPTFIDYAGLPAEPHPHLPLDGYSMVDLMENPANGDWKGPPGALTVLASRSMEDGTVMEAGIAVPEAQIYSLRTKDFRYIICPDGTAELYHHPSDPYEWTNLAGDPEYAEIQRQLHAQAEAITGVSLGNFFAE